MGTGKLDTDLSQQPYFDDWTANAGYYQVLYKPTTQVQTRELNAMQSQAQYQISCAGDNIFTSGTIVSGCPITFNKSLPYVKILDNWANGSSFDVSDFVGNFLLSNSGLMALVFDSTAGFVTSAPNLNTLYVNYLNSATSNSQIKVFQNDEVLTVLSSANVSTAANLGQIQIANSISSGSSNTTGKAYAMTVGDGVIYQKGYFVDALRQSIIVDRYDDAPDSVSVGFQTNESIVTAYQDPSLFDNAQGVPNPSAPGADRLGLTPTLVIRTSTPDSYEIQQTNSSSNTWQGVANSGWANTNDFFPLVEFVGGSPSIINQDTSYATIGAAMAKRTFETNGNFVMKPFNLLTSIDYYPNTSIEPNNVILSVGTGSAYVQGNRIDVTGSLRTTLRKGTDVGSSPSQIVTAQLGNYFFVDEFAGWMTPGEQVSLYDAPAHAVSSYIHNGTSVDGVTANGNNVGNATVVGIEFDSGTASTPNGQYRVYLQNVVVATGQSLANVKSIFANTGGAIGSGDVVLQANQAFLQATSFRYLIFPTGAQAVKSLLSPSGNAVTQFQQKAWTNVSFQSTGNVSISIAASTGSVSVFPWGVGQLDPEVAEDMVLICGSTTLAVNAAGSVATTASSNVITGSGTSFTNAFTVGSVIHVANSTTFEDHLVTGITNATSLTVLSTFTNSISGNAAVKYVQGQPIPDMYSTANVYVSSANTMSITLPQSLSGSMAATLYYDIQHTAANPATLLLNNSVCATINCASHTNGFAGPWCLGVPGGFALTHVYVGTNYSNTNPDLVQFFSLDSGGRDLYWGPSYLSNPGGTAGLSVSSRMLVQFESLAVSTSTGSGFLSIDSYPIDDTGATPNTIFTWEVPLYISPVTGAEFDLRDSVDMRPWAANTIPYVSNATLAASNTLIINPANSVVLTSSWGPPVPDSQVETEVQYWMGRYTKVCLNGKARLIVADGVPGVNPVPPPDPAGSMVLAIIDIPPYPSLTHEYQGLNVGNNAIMSFDYYTNKRYRMSDIAQLDAEIQQLQYYTSLNMLELSASNLLLLTSSGQNRFQNGMIADSFQDFSVCNLSDPAFAAAIDPANTVCRPVFYQQNIGLKLSNSLSSGIALSNNGRLVTISDSQYGTPIISQPFATKVRDCSQDIMYVWQGTMTLTPSGCYQPDVTVNPTVISNLTQYANFTDLPNGWQSLWGNWTENYSASLSSNSGNSSSTTSSNSGVVIGTSVTVSNTGLLSVASSNSTYNLGTYVTDVALQPWIPQTVIEFNVTGLKPSTQLYSWFNGDSVSGLCVQIPDGRNANSITGNTIVGNLMSNANGAINGLFFLPSQTFHSGELPFVINDVPNLVVYVDDITTQAVATFNGTNLAYTANDIVLTTEGYATVAPPATNQPNTVPVTVTPTTNSTANTACGANGLFEVVLTSNAQLANVTSSIGNPVSLNVNGNAGNVVYLYRATTIPNENQFLTLLGYNPNAPILKGGTGYFCPNGVFVATSNTVLVEPLAQGIQIPQIEDDNGNQVDGIFISSIDLFFASKDETLGVTVQIRDMENGYPGPHLVTFGQVWLPPSSVNVSLDSSAVTNVQFPAPVFLQSNTAYCFVVIPDGANPNYSLFTAAISGTDILTGSPVYSQVPNGVLFSSSQNSTWTAYDSEFMKYNIYVWDFATPTAAAVFTNDDSEYFQLSNQTGAFGMSEPLYFSNNILFAANATTSNTSNVIICSNSATVTNNAAIFVGSISNVLGYVTTVTSIVNSTAFQVSSTPPFSDAAATVGNLSGNGALTANLAWQAYTGLFAASGSTANSTVYFSNTGGATLIGAWSGCFANVVSVVDIPYDTIMPKFATLIPAPDTALSFAALGTSNVTSGYVSDSTSTNLVLGVSTDFYDEERAVLSKSNEMAHLGGAKSLFVAGSLATSYNFLSPAIDTVKSGAVTVYNLINSDDANNDVYWSETTNFGGAISRYITKTVNLASGLDAEDLVVYLGAYWPADTDIYVYAKMLCVYDPDPFSVKSWTPMSTTNNYRSSKVDKTDVAEFIFTLPTTAPYAGATANTTWQAAFNASGWLNNSNDGILQYKPASGQVYQTFSSFAIKVVFVSSAGSYLVPFLTDMRAIATTAAEGSDFVS